MTEYTTDKKLYWSSIKKFRRFLGETLNFVETLRVSRIFRRYFQILGDSRIFRRHGNPDILAKKVKLGILDACICKKILIKEKLDKKLNIF